MRFSNRRLFSDGATANTAPVIARNLPLKTAVSNAETAAGLGSAASRSKSWALQQKYKREASKQRDNKVPAAAANIETADIMPTAGLGVDTTVSDVATRNYLTPLLEEFIPNPEANPYIPPVYLYNIYRDIYYYDTISGGAVDMMEKLAFSDFNLTGLSDKQMEPFEKAVESMKIRRLLPQLSNDYLIHGMYAGQMIWDDKLNTYVSIIPHNPSFTYIKPHPIFGQDPQVSVDFSGSMREIGGTNSRNRKNIAHSKIEGLPSGMLDNDRYTIPVDDLIYLARGGMTKDIRGVSYLKRVMPIWLLEKLLARGTIDGASKRQRSIPHLAVGDEDWIPSPDDMKMLAEMWTNAALDPMGAVFVTRNGVNIDEVMRGDDFWKWPDIYDWASQAKMRALSINEAVLSGDATLNTMDMAMSVFIEQVRSHRDNVTYDVFYERMFPRISVENNIRYKKKKNDWEETAKSLEVAVNSPIIDLMKVRAAERSRRSAFELASSYKEFDPAKHAFPRINWHKRLRPEADQSYMDILGILRDNGLPIPMAMWAAAGGIDIDSLLEGMDDDIRKRQSTKHWKEITAPPEQGDQGGFGGGGGAEEGSVQGFTKRVGLMNRDYSALEETFGVRNLTGDGKRKLLSARGKKELEEKVLKKVAQACVEIARRENAKVKQGG